MTRIGKSPGIERALDDVFPVPIKATRAPTSTDIRFPVGQMWVRIDTAQVYILAKLASGAASWTLASPGASDVDTLTGDSGGAISPSGGTIILAGGTNLTTVGSGHTITFNLDAAITLATSVTSPIYASAAGMAINVAAGNDITVKMGDASGSNKISFVDSASSEVASLDSDGTLTVVEIDGALGANTPAAAVVTTLVAGTSVSSPIYTSAAAADTNINSASGQDIIIQMGDAAGSNKVSFEDSASAEVASLDSNGNLSAVQGTFSGNLILSSVATYIQMNGGAVTDFIGQATLSSGTVTVANTNIASGDRIFLSRASLNSSTALGHLTVTAQTASTSFVITAIDPTDATSTITGDTSIVNYVIIRQN